MKKWSIFEKMSIAEFSIFLIIVVTFILALIYFIFFREMDRELRTIEIRQTGLSMR